MPGMYQNNNVPFTDGVEPSDCEDGDVRLTGVLPNQGRVEICRGDIWGSVCNYYFSAYDADTICRMLGYYNQGTKFDRNYLLLQL